MPQKPTKEPRSKKENNHSSDDEALFENDPAWWAAIPEDQLTGASKPAEPTRGEIPKSPAGGRVHNFRLGYNPGVRILSKHPSAPVVTSEPVVGRNTMSSFPSRSVGHLVALPTTPPKPSKISRDPPSTGRTKAITQALEHTFLSPSKKGKEKTPQPKLQPQRPGLATGSQSIRTVFIDDDDEEEEVSDMLMEPDSLPSTRPGSLFDYDLSQKTATTPASSWSVDPPKAESSWSSLEVEITTKPVASSARKRPRSSGASEVTVKRGNPPTKPKTPPVDVFTGPSLPKVPKVNFGDLPKRPSPPKLSPPDPSPLKLSPPEPSPPKPITVSSLSDAPQAVSAFFHGVLGADIPPVVIAHSSETQKVMDQLHLGWGVQYELARGVSLKHWTWEDVQRVLQEKPKELQGTNAEAAFKVGAIMRGREAQEMNRALWQELDREQAAIVENKGRGLGLMGHWHGQDGWFGGRIQQIARLTKGRDSRYGIHLEHMERRRSHRFARYCGSRRILQLRVPKDLILEEGRKLKAFLQGKFVLCGRVFVPFHAKDHSLYMVETNEDWEREPQRESGDENRPSFADFINWHNPPEFNHKQALSKYVTRFALGLSTSIPVIEFEESNMYYIDDIYGNEYRGGKASAEETMTDGCGFINQSALVAINVHINKASLPVAIQGRIAGAKGLWILHPSDNSPEFKIWIRDSQNKIKFPKLDRAHRILELVAASQPSTSISISRQSIVNLSHNGVPDTILMSYLEKGLTEEIEPLVNWDRPNAPLYLWYAINTTGAVSRTRLARVTSGISRALGLTRRQWKEVDDGDADDGEMLFDETNSALTGRNEYSKTPLSLNEFTLELVQAGFHPSHSKTLRNKLQYVIQQTIKNYVEKYRIPLPESLDGFVVPDPLGILEEGEIYYRSSQSILDPRTQRTFDIVTGDVVLGRYPIRIASDLQKVKAVNKLELYQWPDVIIASTKGSRSLASYLSGGDMDGDELFILREPELVEPFINKPLVPPPDDLLEANFQKHVETVSQFCERVKDKPSTEQHSALQSALLLSLNEDRKGLYSMFHDGAIEKHGYDHPKAIRLAYMFNTLLDASKSGLILADGIFEKDQAENRRHFPSIEDTYFGDPDSPMKRAVRFVNPESSAFILNKLERAGEAKGKELLEKFSKAAVRCTDKVDPELEAPYEAATSFANDVFEKTKMRFLTEDLSKIRKHVQAAYDVWLESAAKAKPQKKGKGSSRSGGGGDDSMSSRAARLFGSPIDDIIATPNVEEIKASYAYKNWWGSPFAFQVAFGQLCEIKAKAAKGGLAPCIRDIDEMKSVPSSCIKAVEKIYND